MPPQFNVWSGEAVLGEKEAVRQLPPLLAEELVPHVVPPQLEAFGVQVALEEADGLQHVEHRALSHPLRQGSELARLPVAHVHQPGRAHQVIVARALARVYHDEIVWGEVVALVGPYQMYELDRRICSVLGEEVDCVISLPRKGLVLADTNSLCFSDAFYATVL